MLQHVYSAGIYAGDQQRSLDFFTQTLGFTLLGDYPMGDSTRWIEVAPAGSQTPVTKLILFTPEEQKERIGTFSNVIFTCDDVQKTYEELTAKGVTFKDTPTKQFWGWWAVFLDPDGNSYGLVQAAE